MIAVDTSTMVAFFRGEAGKDVEALDRALASAQVALPPVVLTELLSDPKLDPAVSKLLLALPLLEIEPGYWERAAALRAKVLGKRLRARLTDTLISQSCVDAEAPLITRDEDFRHFSRHGALLLV